MTDAPAPAPASLVANSSWLLISRIAGLVLGGALSIYAINTLSQGDWGRFSTVIALIAIFTVFTDAGLASLTLRELSEPGADRNATVSTALSAVLLTGAASLALMFATALVLGYWSEPVLIVIAGGTLVCQALATPIFSVFNAARILAWPALLTGIGAVVSTGIGIALVAGGVGPAALLLGMLAAQVLAAAGGYTLMRRKLSVRPRPRRPDAEVRRFLKTAIPIALTGGLTVIYQRLDILMLSKLADDEAVAIYAVPFSLVQYTWMIPQIIAAAFYPILAAALAEDRRAAADAFWLVVRIFFVLSLPVTVFLVIAGGPLMSTVFGEEYGASATVLSIMAWISVLGFQNYVLWYGILAVHKERAVVKIQAAGLVVNAGLNAVLIPLFGPEGAAAALLVSDLIVVAGQAWIVHRHVFAIPWRAIFARPIVATVVAAAVAIALLQVSEFLAGVGAAAAYAVVLLAWQYVTWEEWRPLRDALPFRRATA